MFFYFFLKNLLHHFVVLHVVRQLHTKLVALATAGFGGDIEEVITGDFLDQVMVVGALPRTL